MYIYIYSHSTSLPQVLPFDLHSAGSKKSHAQKWTYSDPVSESFWQNKGRGSQFPGELSHQYVYRWSPIPSFQSWAPSPEPLNMHGCVLSHFSRVRLCATLWTVAPQSPLSMGFCRQEYWSGLSCPSPGDLPNLRSNLHVLYLLHWQVDSLPLAPHGKPTF